MKLTSLALATCFLMTSALSAAEPRVSLNDNPAEDLFVEVNHGPFLVDNNIMLSQT